MNRAIKTVPHTVNELYKSCYGKIVASVLQFINGVNLETIEDLVQDSFASALVVWAKEGIPSNPAGWIFFVCKNKALNKIKEVKRVRGFYENEDFYSIEPKFSESAFDDQHLKLLFSCAHPDLSPKVQVVITLKYVVNLKVEAIAKVLGMTIDGIDKLLLRARQKIREERILLDEPDLSGIKNRLPIVHKILYLVYNEGYRSSWGKEILREELCEEALLMTKALIDGKLGDTDTEALYALMLFNSARFKTRFGPSGELMDLEGQDRTLWDRNLILLGCDFLKGSAGDFISAYHCEAAIAYLHCSAKNFNATNWASISNLYLQLLRMNPNPFVELNYAVALYYSGQKQTAIDILNKLKQNPFLNQYYLLNATLGKIHLLDGNYVIAKQFFVKTLQGTDIQIEKDYVQKLIDKINKEQ